MPIQEAINPDHLIVGFHFAMTGLLDPSVLRGPLLAPQPFQSKFISRPICFQHIAPYLSAYFHTFRCPGFFRLIPLAKLFASIPYLK